MAEFPYTPQPARIPKFFDHIQAARVPPRVTHKYLVAAGFKSSNDRYLIPLLRTLGFIDGSGQPTETWQEYRKKDQAKGVMGSAIRMAYSGLFEMYEDAWRKDREALNNYFSGETTVGETTVDLIVRTFNTLCDRADFAASQEPSAAVARKPASARPLGSREVVVQGTSGAADMTINLNIQLQLPPTQDAEVYDKLFESMKKHLLS
jgi:hypothetical protein